MKPLARLLHNLDPTCHSCTSDFRTQRQRRTRHFEAGLVGPGDRLVVATHEEIWPRDARVRQRRELIGRAESHRLLKALGRPIIRANRAAYPAAKLPCSGGVGIQGQRPLDMRQPFGMFPAKESDLRPAQIQRQRIVSTTADREFRRRYATSTDVSIIASSVVDQKPATPGCKTVGCSIGGVDHDRLAEQLQRLSNEDSFNS